MVAMRRLAPGVTVVAGVAVWAVGVGYGSASTAGGWVVTDVAAQARQAYPGYTGIALVGMTADDRVLWTAQAVGGSQYVREVFQRQNGTISDLGTLPHGMNPRVFNREGDIAGSDLFIPTMPPPGFQFPPTRGFLWRQGKVTVLGMLAAGSAASTASMTGARSSRRARRARHNGHRGFVRCCGRTAR
jgi:hypothetical protein